MKKNMIYLCYYINVMTIGLYAIVILVSIITMSNKPIDFINTELMLNIRLIVNIPIIVLLVYNIQMWSKYDRKLSRLLLLIFFIGLYNPIYFNKLKKMLSV